MDKDAKRAVELMIDIMEHTIKIENGKIEVEGVEYAKYDDILHFMDIINELIELNNKALQRQ